MHQRKNMLRETCRIVMTAINNMLIDLMAAM